ncbi:Hypothetical protein, putative [Bodo saltans]|uniref:Uncharacterized protein n=1 Tax=Bodo saltans TaxID=75058 RepID=A0A0S4JJL9_BODSA|nr:Hypothetical protein, putative [Bodo saltans]|eukprot:CUG91741.1 Hypothetical protein, putative [Bodo saltans]
MIFQNNEPSNAKVDLKRHSASQHLVCCQTLHFEHRILFLPKIRVFFPLPVTQELSIVASVQLCVRLVDAPMNLLIGLYTVLWSSAARVVLGASTNILLLPLKVVEESGQVVGHTRVILLELRRVVVFLKGCCDLWYLCCYARCATMTLVG